MVDVLNNYVQDAISVVRLHRRPCNSDGTDHNPDERPTAFGLKRNATEKQRIRNEIKDQEKKFIDRSLYQIKETPLAPLLEPQKQMPRLACKYCAPARNVSTHSASQMLGISIIQSIERNELWFYYILLLKCL